MKRRARTAGFTLIELLVAMFITAILFTIGYGAINQAIRNREVIAEKQERLLALQRTMRLLVQDLTQVAPRPVREQNGATQPALMTDTRNTYLVALTRGGWANPAGIVPRSELQRVRYVLEDDTLYRESFRVLDPTLNTKPSRRKLIDAVTSVRFRFMNEARAWQDTWPPLSNPPSPQDLRVRPIAVEVAIEFEDWGRIVRLIEVAG